MFCSVNCQNIADNMYHNYECIINAMVSGVQHMSQIMRPFFCALFHYQHNIEDLMTFVLSRNNFKKTIFDYDSSEGMSCENSMHWLHIFDSIDAPSVNDLSAVLPSIFESHPVLACMWISHKDFILPYLNRHADIICFIAKDSYQWPANAVPLLKNNSQKKALDLIRVQKIVGSVTFLFYPLLSQSCKPNVYSHINKDNEMCYIVARNINKGEKLTISKK